MKGQHKKHWKLGNNDDNDNDDVVDDNDDNTDDIVDFPISHVDVVVIFFLVCFSPIFLCKNPKIEKNMNFDQNKKWKQLHLWKP